MAIRVAINGFGRIGRLVLRALYEEKRDDIDVIAINDLGSAEANAHLLKYDSVHGRFNEEISVDAENNLVINGKKIKILAERDPAQLPWKDLDIDICFECTGIFTAKEKAVVHLEAGAKRVLVSAPSAGADKTIVFGVNQNTLTADDLVVSNASCTTNSLAPVAYVLQKEFGIVHGLMTTIHSYTGDQRIVDTLHKDLRRARAAALSSIPTSTGAAKAVGEVLPELKGKLDGFAIRVPTPNVSIVDLKAVLNKDVTKEEINAAMEKYAEGELKGILAVNKEPLVSTDFNHTSVSSTFDASQTKVIDGNFISVLAWYDNEWGFSCRMGDTAAAMAKFL